MPGLLDTMFGTPDQTTAMGLLGIGLMRGDFGQGAGMAMQYMGDAKRRQLQEGLLSAQLAETLAQAKEREARMAQMERQTRMQDRVLNGDGTGVSPGAFSPGGDGMGPVMPQGERPLAGGLIGYARQIGIPEQAIQTDVAFNGGKGIAEMIYKRGTPDMQVTNGFAYDKNNVRPGFMPQMNISQTGQASLVTPGQYGLPEVSAPRGAVETFRGYKQAEAEVAAQNDLMKVVGSDGSERYVPRSQVLQAAQPQRQPARQAAAPSAASPQAGLNGAFRGDPAAVMEQIMQIRDPQERANAQAAFREQFAREGVNFGAGPMQATQTSAQAAAAAGAKARAEAEGKGAGERTTAQVGKSDKAKDMLGYLTEARMILEYGQPTGSGVGAAADAVGSFVGVSTVGSRSASRLDAISGWLTSNVPRMEGPQSNYDVENYKIMAGRVGDRRLPVADRLAALDVVEGIQKKYASLNGVQPQATQQPQRQAPSFASLPAASAYKGKIATDTQTGEQYRSDGMGWVRVKR